MITDYGVITFLLQMIKFILQDWATNSGNRRSQFVLAAFRLAQQFHHLPSSIRWIGLPYFSFYELFIVWALGIEISYKATIGSGLHLFHGVGTVVHESVVMGKSCTLRHCTTLGMKKTFNDVPILGDHVDIGCNSVIMGAIHIGNKVTIGAGSIVFHDIPDHSVVAGNPARILK